MQAGLLGRKLAHSLSPIVHRLFGDYEYRLYEREPEEVESFLREGDYAFLNVTIPYKRKAAESCASLSPIAERLGNVNFVRRDERGELVGDNTDYFGFKTLLDSLGVSAKGKRVSIFGAGGAAMTAKAVLEDALAKEVRLIARGEDAPKDSELLVNATPVGMFPEGDAVRFNVADYPACEAVVDLVYNPSPTRLVREALACGKIAADGLVMLIAQAYRAFELASSSLIPHPSSLFLYGPPASGKSTLAKKIAAATGWRLVDLDAEIVKQAGRSIPEIFASEGEKEFRRIEKNCLKKVCSKRDDGDTAPQVVALGGGALLDPESRRLAEGTGRVIVLDCSLETLKSRLTGGDRPLSADVVRLEALVAARAAHYASFLRHVAF